MNQKFKYTSLLLVFSLLFIGCNKEEKKQEVQKQAPKPQKVEVLTLEKKPVPLWISFVGKTQASKSVDVIARVPGRLEKMHFKAGSFVKEGDILFEIEDDEYLATLEQQKAKLAQDKANLQLAKNNIKRYEPLVAKELASKEKLDELIAQKKEVEAMVLADKAAIRQAKLNLSYCTIVARISGKIGRNLIDVGNMVGSTSENSKLANIVASDPMFVYFHPSNNDVQKMLKYKSQKNMPVKAYQPDARTENGFIYYKGNIDFIDNTTNITTGTVTIRASVENKKYTLFPGSFVNIDVFVTDKIPVISIPPEAIYQNQLGSFVYIVDKDNKVKIKQFKQAFATKDLVAVKNGIEAGDKIIVSGTQKLKVNLLVEPKETTKTFFKIDK